MIQKVSKSQQENPSELFMSADTVSLLIPRLRLSLTSIKDRRKLKQTEELLGALEEFKKVLEFRELYATAGVSGESLPFLQGLPRCLFQIEEQFRRYTNPPSLWQEQWAQLRAQFWNTLERSVPWSVKEILVSWRWNAELSAAKRIESELQKSRDVVGHVHKELLREEKLGNERRISLTLKDRFDIVLWSRSAKKNEAVLVGLEQQRDSLATRSAELLEQCEKISAGVALGLRTLYVDCGEYFGLVFEDNCRAIDRDIRAKKETETSENERLCSQVQSQFEFRQREAEIQNAKIKDKNKKLLMMLSDDAEEKVISAEKLIGHEFYCLNALDIEKQDLARKRWRRAVSQMQRAVETAEESFNNEEPDSRRLDADGTRGASAS